MSSNPSFLKSGIRSLEPRIVLDAAAGYILNEIDDMQQPLERFDTIRNSSYDSYQSYLDKNFLEYDEKLERDFQIQNRSLHRYSEAGRLSLFEDHTFCLSQEDGIVARYGYSPEKERIKSFSMYSKGELLEYPVGVAVSLQCVAPSSLRDSEASFVDSCPVFPNCVGKIKIDSDGSLEFTPSSNYYGFLPLISCVLVKNNKEINLLVEIDVFPVNDSPEANFDMFLARENHTLDVPSSRGLLINDRDPDGDHLSVVNFSVGSDVYTSGEKAIVSGWGNLTINSDGSFTFSPKTNFRGFPPQHITYEISDEYLKSSNSVVIQTVPEDPYFLAVPDIMFTHPGTLLKFDARHGLFANDIYPKGSSVYLNSFRFCDLFLLPNKTVSVKDVGKLRINSDGSGYFAPAQHDYLGKIPDGYPPAISYEITDGRSFSSSTLQVVVYSNSGCPLYVSHKIQMPSSGVYRLKASDFTLSSSEEKLFKSFQFSIFYRPSFGVLILDKKPVALSQRIFLSDLHRLSFEASTSDFPQSKCIWFSVQAAQSQNYIPNLNALGAFRYSDPNEIHTIGFISYPF